jgi:predicted short-subunit dehydrogenase-like oxidoreductase (DUF2520 family)
MTIGIVGSGNMAYQLAGVFNSVKVPIVGIYARNMSQATYICQAYAIPFYQNIKDLKADIIFLCVSDDAIGEVSALLSTESLVVHTSGSTSIENIVSKNRAVFYPLQTMTKMSLVDFTEVPVFITALDESVSLQLQELAKRISNQVHVVNDEQRINVHLSAVTTNNFINHLVVKSKELLEKNSLSYEIIVPLLKTTLDKLTILPYNFEQTGPAKRGDTNVLKKHIELLEGDENLKAIYQAMSKSIHDYENKNRVTFTKTDSN